MFRDLFRLHFNFFKSKRNLKNNLYYDYYLPFDNLDDKWEITFDFLNKVDKKKRTVNIMWIIIFMTIIAIIIDFLFYFIPFGVYEIGTKSIIESYFYLEFIDLDILNLENLMDYLLVLIGIIGIVFIPIYFSILLLSGIILKVFYVIVRRRKKNGKNISNVKSN